MEFPDLRSLIRIAVEYAIASRSDASHRWQFEQANRQEGNMLGHGLTQHFQRRPGIDERALLPLVLLPLLMHVHVSTLVKQGRPLTVPAWTASPFRSMLNPLPSFHLMRWLCLVSGCIDADSPCSSGAAGVVLGNSVCGSRAWGSDRHISGSNESERERDLCGQYPAVKLGRDSSDLHRSARVMSQHFSRTLTRRPDLESGKSGA